MVTLKNHSNLRKETIQFEPMPDGTYRLKMIFDANFECLITVYVCAVECRNALTTPL